MKTHYSEVNIKPIERIDKVMRHNIFQYLNDTKRGDFLDIGFGWGNQLRVAKEMGFTKISGLEIDKNVVDIVKKEFDVKWYDGKKFPYKDGSFDVVLMYMVIEHLKDPSEIIAEMYRVLRYDGEIIIVTQDPSQCNAIFSNFWEDQTHVRPYPRIAIENLLRIEGFKIKKSYIKVAHVPIVQRIMTMLGFYKVYYGIMWLCNLLKVGTKEVCVIGKKEMKQDSALTKRLGKAGGKGAE